MPFCSNCGKTNRDDSRFCQFCGQPLPPSSFPPVNYSGVVADRLEPLKPSKSLVEIPDGGPVCSSCGTLNVPGMKFCKMCGANLEPIRSQPANVSQPARITCPSCNHITPGGAKFCQHCGAPLPKRKVISVKQSARPSKAGQENPANHAVRPVQTADMMTNNLGEVDPPTIPHRPSVNVPQNTEKPFSAGINPNPAANVKNAGKPNLAQPSIPAPPQNPVVIPEPHRSRRSTKNKPFQALISGAIQAEAAAQPPGEINNAKLNALIGLIKPEVTKEHQEPDAPIHLAIRPQTALQGQAKQQALDRSYLAKLVAINRNGNDGEIFYINETTFDIGRSQGQIQFPHDPYLSDRHCRYILNNGKWFLQDLQSLNGIYHRLQEPYEVRNGDQFLVGSQILFFELLNETEKNMSPAVEHGVLFLGSILKVPWARLRQVSMAGVTRDIYFLYRSKIIIGRETADILFPDDEFMSRQHLAFTLTGDRATVHDLGSSNGTYVRIRELYEIKPTDVIRIGEQLLRFEV